MVKVEQVTKRFAGVTAVQDLSFSVERGEVVGLLGPNGAGKTTTMRMLSGYILPSSGSVCVAGCDAFRQARDLRRHIGYLPEHCPLHDEMRVLEYLRFRAGLKELWGRKRRRQIKRVLALCGLEQVQRRIIGQLSLGYRQRVGLADALLHNPALLILDEPTLGLDPQQVRSLRRLIRQLASAHTIFISTHILSEVDVTCDRAIILQEGRLLADASLNDLRAGHADKQMIFAEILGDAARVRETLNTLPFVSRIQGYEKEGWQHLVVEVSGGNDRRLAISNLCIERGWPIRELREDHLSFEDVYLKLIEQAGVLS